MLAVIFEMDPDPDQRDPYLATAAQMREYLEQMDGFISIERFESLSSPGRLLSLSFWRDEDSLNAWRNLEAHRAAQQKGRESYFRDYRLRVASVIRDYSLTDREQAPADSREVHG